MSTEIIKDTTSLQIHWKNHAGDDWMIVKRFTRATDEMLDAYTLAPFSSRYESAQAIRQQERELHYAAALAEEMDQLFTKPTDFDRVVVDEPRQMNEYCPVFIFPSGDKIHIAKRKV